MSRYIGTKENLKFSLGFDINGGYFFDVEDTSKKEDEPVLLEETDFLKPLDRIQFLKLCLKYKIIPPEIDINNFRIIERFNPLTGKII